MKKKYQQPNIKARHIQPSVLMSGSGNSFSNTHGEQNVQYSKSYNQYDDEEESTAYPTVKSVWEE